MMKDRYIKAFGPVLATLRNAQLSSDEQCERLDEACSKCGRELAKWKYESLEVPLYDDPGLEDLEVDADEAEYLRGIVADQYRYSSMLIGAICANNPADGAVDERPYLDWTGEEIEAEADRVAPDGEMLLRKIYELAMKQGKTLDALQATIAETKEDAAGAKAAAEQAAQTTAGLPAAIADTKAAAKGAKDAAESARAAAEKAAKKPTTVINAQPGATVNVVKPSRTDAGGTHGKTARGWRTQEDMATDFSKSATKICGKWYGEVSVAVAKDWEARYPNEARRERKSGYHAGLRNEPNPTPETKKAYYEAAANWNDYWRKHNEAFNAWLKANPNGDHATFLKTWERPGKTVHRNDTDKTMRYGADTSLPDVLDSGDFDNET